MPVSLDYVTRETASNLWRNRLMTIAAVLTVAVSLSLVGAALLLKQGAANAEVDWQRGYSVLVNTPEETAFARQVGVELVGASKVIAQGPAQSASEDFAFMLEKVPGSYLVIGNGDGDSAGACRCFRSCRSSTGNC